MRHLLFACLLATMALTTSGCAAVIFGLVGAVGCRGNTGCIGDAISGGAAIDGAILEAAAQGGGRRSAGARHGYVCTPYDYGPEFAAPRLRDAQRDCMTYGSRAGTEGECACRPAGSVRFPAPRIATGPRFLPPPTSNAPRGVPPPPNDEPRTSPPGARGPTEDEVREALSFAAVRARECGASSYGTAGTDVVFERDGSVRSVELHAVGLPPKLRACVAEAVWKARVPPFERETIHVRYPIRL